MLNIILSAYIFDLGDYIKDIQMFLLDMALVKNIYSSYVAKPRRKYTYFHFTSGIKAMKYKYFLLHE